MIAFGGVTALGTSFFRHATIGPSTKPKNQITNPASQQVNQQAIAE